MEIDCFGEVCFRNCYLQLVGVVSTLQLPPCNVTDFPQRLGIPVSHIPSPIFNLKVLLVNCPINMTIPHILPEPIDKTFSLALLKLVQILNAIWQRDLLDLFWNVVAFGDDGDLLFDLPFLLPKLLQTASYGRVGRMG